MAQERALPPVVARMWGREPVTSRGPRPRLDLAKIVTAAIELADAEGLARPPCSPATRCPTPRSRTA
ncbi:hypothetical protein [Nonomuraea glycinis]|uniref:hypothetical protein n=1 Tax=Nonomuraea glycinis TaxID=2047744 RepID=UPI002E149C2C|nr:hypothetical protein OHA68_37835 [Nonomuraea glycinis]